MPKRPEVPIVIEAARHSLKRFQFFDCSGDVTSRILLSGDTGEVSLQCGWLAAFVSQSDRGVTLHPVLILEGMLICASAGAASLTRCVQSDTRGLLKSSFYL